MKRLKCLKSLKLNNSGAAMVNMIIVVLFVTILATTLLYISGMNFQIKQTDYRNTVSFYQGETNLERFKEEFMVNTSDAALRAYNSTMREYVSLGTGGAREWQYYQYFIDEIKAEWDSKTGGDWYTWLNGKMIGGSTLELDLSLDTSGDGKLSTNEIITVEADKGYVIIQNVKVTYTNPDGYTSIITTDFYVAAPPFNWDVDESNQSTLTSDADKLAAMEKDEINISECVQYVEWQKQ